MGFIGQWLLTIETTEQMMDHNNKVTLCMVVGMKSGNNGQLLFGVYVVMTFRCDRLLGYIIKEILIIGWIKRW